MLVREPNTVPLDRIGLEEAEDEEEDGEFCAYAIVGTAFKTTMVNSSNPVIAMLTNSVLRKNFEDDSFSCLSITTISINLYYKVYTLINSKHQMLSK
jgi:hypothetical protein